MQTQLNEYGYFAFYPYNDEVSLRSVLGGPIRIGSGLQDSLEILKRQNQAHSLHIYSPSTEEG